MNICIFRRCRCAGDAWTIFFPSVWQRPAWSKVYQSFQIFGHLGNASAFGRRSKISDLGQALGAPGEVLGEFPQGPRRVRGASGEDQGGYGRGSGGTRTIFNGFFQFFGKFWSHLGRQNRNQNAKKPMKNRVIFSEAFPERFFIDFGSHLGSILGGFLELLSFRRKCQKYTKTTSFYRFFRFRAS